MKEHLLSDTHIWCHQFGKNQENRNKLFTEQNTDTCTIQVRNVLFCLKTCGSSMDFTKENDKDVLNYNTSQCLGTKPPTKNDSKLEFFNIRKDAFCLLTDNIQEKFRKVKTFSVTLD